MLLPLPAARGVSAAYGRFCVERIGMPSPDRLNAIPNWDEACERAAIRRQVLSARGLFHCQLKPT